MKKSTIIKSFIVAIAVSFALCSLVEGANEVGRTTAPLSGPAVSNDVNTPEANAVVLVGGGCTGTLIKADIVLTAGHCISHNHPGTVTDSTGRQTSPEIIRDEYENDWETPGEWYPLYNHPGGIRISFGRDASAPVYNATAVKYNIPAHADMVALKLNLSIPASVAIPKPIMYRNPMHSPLWQNERFRIAGWGGGATIRKTGPAGNGIWPCNTSFGLHPHKMCVTGSAVELGDSGGPLFWNNPNDRNREYLIGVTQGMEPNGGRFTVTFYSGGMMGTTPIPDIGAWLAQVTGTSSLTVGFPASSRRVVTRPTSVSWEKIGHPRDARKIAACMDGSLWALNHDMSLWVNRNGGTDSGWRRVINLPDGTRNIACGSGLIFFQKDNRELWTVDDPGGPRERMRKLGKPWAAAEIAGAEDATYDFPVLWALNDDKTLWSNANNGLDEKWKKAGKPHSAIKIAATQNAVFALNHDKTLWINRRNGADDSWQKIDKPHAAIEITAYEYNGKLRIYALNSDYTLWEGSLR